MRDLGVQAGNDSNNAEARANIATEVSSLTEELDRIGASTNFNGTNLLDGTAGGNGKMKFQVGADGDANSAIEVDLSGANVKSMTGDLKSGTITGGNHTDVDASALVDGDYVFSVDNGAGEVKNVTVAYTKPPTATVEDFASQLNKDAEFSASFTASVVKDPVSGNATGVLVRANNGGTVADPTGTGVSANAGAATTGLNFSDHDAAQQSLAAIDTKIKAVSTARAQLGAYQNRFEHTIANTNVAVENLSASESRIRDTDMAQEMMSFTRSQILTQAGTAMLSQANQSQQGVLSLLR
jgi:flagellin